MMIYLCARSTQVGVNLYYHSLSEYTTETGMAENRQWGTEVELFTVNHLLRTKVYTYSRDGKTWQVHSPSGMCCVLETVLVKT